MRGVGVWVAVLAGVLVGCAEWGGAQSPVSSAEESAASLASPTVSDSASAEPSVSPSPTPTRTTSTPSGPPTSSITAAVPPAPKPTRLQMTVVTKGGRLDLVRGGSAQEFTVTLRNGNIQAYERLRLAFQMEILLDGTPAAERPPQDGFVLEHWDATAGAWRSEELRIANDAAPHWLYEGGIRLAREAVRSERYRLRAEPAGPVGSTPLMVSLINTDAPQSASTGQARPGFFSLPHITQRG